MKRYILPLSLRYLLRVYLLGLAFFTGFRLILLYLQWDNLRSLPHAESLLAQSMYMGFRFDTVISCYLLALPCLLLCVADLARFLSRKFLLAVHILLMLLYVLAFFGCAADLPFYTNYNTRLNATVLTWMSTPSFVIKMILQEKTFLVYLFLFAVIACLFLFAGRRIYRRYAVQTITAIPHQVIWKKAAMTILAFGLLFLGIRGRTTLKTPIQVGTAFFCPYNFPNQLGLNPMFTFIRSYLDNQKEEYRYVQLMDEQKAMELVQQYLHVPQPLPYAGYPIARPVPADSAAPARGCNVVLVLMESMSAANLQRYGNTEHLTPYLDELSTQSLCFDNFYSAGLHTYNGIFSTLYGFPALLSKHSMYADVIPECTGLSYTLQHNGYHTLFFITHDDQFDNINPFLTLNHFDEVIGQKDYPRSEVLNTLGIPDHKMFGHVLTKLDQLDSGQHKPFFTAIMTGTNHPPFEVPRDISLKPRNYDQRDGAVAYADWSIHQFMLEAAKRPWYDHTIFVFLGDHGAIRYDDMYADVSYAYSHIPLLIHLPKQPAAVIKTSGSQPDVYPVLCGLLGLNYVNNTMGMDLLREQRPFTSFSADDKVAATDNNFIYVWHRDGRENMFVLGGSLSQDVLKEHRSKADSMRKLYPGYDSGHAMAAGQW